VIQTLSLNNLANPTVLVFFVVGIKYAILVRQSTTTRIELYSCANGSLVIKSVLMYVQAFSEIKLDINFLVSGYI